MMLGERQYKSRTATSELTILITYWASAVFTGLSMLSEAVMEGILVLEIETEIQSV